MVRKLACALLGFRRGITERLVRRDVLIECDRLEEDVKLGLGIGKCKLSKGNDEQRQTRLYALHGINLQTPEKRARGQTIGG